MPSSVLHVVFSDAGADDLREALASLGRDDRVAEYTEDLSFGPLAPNDSDVRARWVMQEFGRPDWNELVPMIEQFWAEILSFEGRQIVWWSRRVAREYLGFLDYLVHVGDRACDVIELTDVMIAHHDEERNLSVDRRAICLGLLNARDIVDNDLLALAAPLTDAARSAYRTEWQRLQQENAMLRIVAPDLTPTSVPVTHFDETLLKHVQPRFLKAARILGEVLSDDWDADILNLNIYFLASRLRALDRAGKIESQGNLHRIRYSEVRLPSGEKAKEEAPSAVRYSVMVDGEQSARAAYETMEQALAACRDIVEQSLHRLYRPGMPTQVLLKQYWTSGDDPFISAHSARATVEFFGWSYAKERCAIICGEGTAS